MEKSCDPHFYSSSLCCLNCNCSCLNARMVYFLELKTLKQTLELKAVVTFLFYIWGEELCINSRKCFSKELWQLSGHGVCLSYGVRIFQVTHSASLLRSCLLYELLSDSCFLTVDWSHSRFQQHWKHFI